MPSIRLLFALLCSFILTACGGGGSLETPDGGTANTYTLKVTLHSSDGGNGISQISAAQPGLLRAELKQNGKAYTNQLITFTLTEFDGGTVGTLDPEVGTAQTDASGIAEITLRAGAIAGTGQVTAVFNPSDKDDDLEVPLTFTSLGDDGDTGTVGNKVITLTVLDKNNNVFTDVNPITKDNLGTVTATVTQDGAPVTNGIVVFATQYTGRILSETGTAALNAQGQARVQLSSGDFKGAGKITATLDGEQLSQSAFYYSSGDDSSVEQAEAVVDIKLLTGCNENWTKDRDLVKLDPTDPSSGCTVINRDISSDQLGTVFVSAANASTGDGFNGMLVDVNTTVGKLSPESGKAVTDSFGVALLTLQPGTKNEAGTITATAKGVSASKAFNVGVAEFTLAIDNGLDLKPGSQTEYQPLASGATTVITVSLIDTDDSPLTLPLDVEFSSNCTQAAGSELDASVTSIGGKAEATYRSLGCNGNPEDTVTAVVNGKSISTFLPLSSSSVASIEFVDSTQTVIALKGTGGKSRSESSNISFRLKDELGQPVANSRLDFKLNSYNGGVALNRKSVDTNSEGLAEVTVTAGTIPMPLRVQACYVPSDQIPANFPVDDVTCWKEVYEYCDPTSDKHIEDYPACPAGTLTLVNLDAQIVSVSDLLTISSGLPDNDSFTLSSSNYNVEALKYVNETVDISVYLADHFNNFVPDGTSVHIRAEGGAVGTIDGSQFTPLQQCETVDGTCTVQWRSQNPQPYTDPMWGNAINANNPNTGQINCDTYFGAPAPCANGLKRANSNTATTPASERGVPLAARVTLLATAVGEESYIDRNGNGVFDKGEYYSLYDLPEAFLDNNENGKFDGIDEQENPVDCSIKDDDGNYVNCIPTNTNGGELEEFLASFDDSNDNGKWDGADGKFNGLVCSEAAEENGFCDKNLIHLRRNIEVIMSGSTAYGRYAIRDDFLNWQRNLTAENGESLGLEGITAQCNDVYLTAPSGNNPRWVFQSARPTQPILRLEPSDSELPDYTGYAGVYCDVASVDLSAYFIHVDDDNDANTPHNCDGRDADYDAAEDVCNSLDTAIDIGIAAISPVFYFTDIYGNPMPSQTNIEPSSTNGDFGGSDAFLMPSTNTTRPTFVGVGVGREGTPNKKTFGVLSVKFTTPKGNISQVTMDVYDDG